MKDVVTTPQIICAYLRHLRTTLDTKEGAIHALIRLVARTDRRMDDADPVDRGESHSPFTNSGLTPSFRGSTVNAAARLTLSLVMLRVAP